MIWLVLIVVAIAALVDLRSRQIPDWIPLVLCLCGTAATALGLTPVSWVGLVCGFALALALALPLYAAGGFGGGDLKLVVALGAVLGPFSLLSVLAGMAIAGGVLAVFALARGRRDLAYAPAIALGLLAHVLRTEVFSHVSMF